MRLSNALPGRFAALLQMAKCRRGPEVAERPRTLLAGPEAALQARSYTAQTLGRSRFHVEEPSWKPFGLGLEKKHFEASGRNVRRRTWCPSALDLSRP